MTRGRAAGNVRGCFASPKPGAGCMHASRSVPLAGMCVLRAGLLRLGVAWAGAGAGAGSGSPPTRGAHRPE